MKKYNEIMNRKYNYFAWINNKRIDPMSPLKCIKDINNENTPLLITKLDYFE